MLQGARTHTHTHTHTHTCTNTQLDSAMVINWAQRMERNECGGQRASKNDASGISNPNWLSKPNYDRGLIIFPLPFLTLLLNEQKASSSLLPFCVRVWSDSLCVCVRISINYPIWFKLLDVCDVSVFSMNEWTKWTNRWMNGWMCLKSQTYHPRLHSSMLETFKNINFWGN